MIESTGLHLGLKIEEQPPFELAEFIVYCSRNDGAEEVPIRYHPDEVAVFIDPLVLEAGDQVICDWYNVPLAAGGGTTPVPTSVTLPSTGAGSASNSASGLNHVPVAALVLLGLGLGIGVLRRRSVR